MAQLVAQGSLVAKTGSTGPISYTGVGFRPSLVIFYATIGTATGFTDHAGFSFGAVAGAISPIGRVIAASSVDGGNTTNTARRQNSSTILLIDPDSNKLAEGNLTSFDLDGFTVNWTTVHASNAYIVQYLALGGGDNTQIKVGEIALPTAIDANKAYADPAFQPDFVLFFGVSDDQALDTAAVASSSVNLGAAMSSTSRWANCYRERDAVGSSEVSRYQRTNLCYVALSPTGAVRAEVEFVDFYASGFHLNISTAPGAADRVFYIAIKGGLFKLGSDTARITTPGTKATTGVGFLPKALALTSMGAAANASADTAPSAGGACFGAGVATNARGAVWSGASDAQATMNTACSTQTNKIITTASPAASLASQADLNSFDTDGFTLNWDTVSGTAREFLYWAIGETVVSTSVGQRDLPALTL